MGAPKRQKLRRGQLASGEEFFYLPKPLASRTKLRVVKETPTLENNLERTKASKQVKSPRSRNRRKVKSEE